MSNIKNIIFDFGGVLLNIDYTLTERAFINLGVNNFSALYNQHKASELFEQLETGKITPESFYTIFRNISNMQLTNEQIKNAWNAMLLNLPKERIQFLQKLKSKYKIFLYSNTNEIHYNCFIKTANLVSPNHNFNNLFIKTYYSHLCGFRKPYTESYINILQEQGLNPKETLFIDDTLINIEGAEKAGLQVLHLQHPNTLLNLAL
ncbi:MAG: HAD family phosphatase [Chitinophagales bacterium]|nr:HAD family phosphatase [Chitinophagales bacterium]